VRFVAGKKNSVSLLVPVNGKLNTVQTNTFTEARLGQHLFHALCSSDTVEVPGWGVFLVRPYGADIQLISGLFLPPARRVSFSPNNAVLGESLLRQVASVEGCDPSEAARLVHNVVRGWRVRLDRGERIFLESIGAFSLRNTFQWVFQPALEANFLPESYGLPIYRLPVLVPANEVPARALRATVSPVRWSIPTSEKPDGTNPPQGRSPAQGIETGSPNTTALTRPLESPVPYPPRGHPRGTECALGASIPTLSFAPLRYPGRAPNPTKHNHRKKSQRFVAKSDDAWDPLHFQFKIKLRF
jgi:nucleoid DNA-binding protein